MQETPKLPPYPQSLAGTLLAAREAVMAPIRPLLRAAGVTDQQWRVLRVLSDSGSLDARGIAARAMLYPPSVTRIVRELVERGLLSREIHADDRRRSVIRITAQGAALVQDTAERTAKLLECYAQSFGQERLTRFITEAVALAECLAPLGPCEADAAASNAQEGPEG